MGTSRSWSFRDTGDVAAPGTHGRSWQRVGTDAERPQIKYTGMTTERTPIEVRAFGMSVAEEYYLVFLARRRSQWRISEYSGTAVAETLAISIRLRRSRRRMALWTADLDSPVNSVNCWRLTAMLRSPGR